ncbi:MAG: LamG domain-containing protein, partial [bacterium]
AIQTTQRGTVSGPWPQSYGGQHNRSKAQPKLVAHWTLDEIVGNRSIPDHSHSQLDGIIHGEPNLQPGINNQALVMDGKNNYVTVEPGNHIRLQQFTISGWFKTTSKSPQVFVSKDHSSGKSFEVGISRGGACRGCVLFGVHFSGGIRDFHIYSDRPYNDGQWHQFVAILKKDSSLALYIDGERVAGPDRPDSKTNPRAEYSSDQLEIGMNNRKKFFDGYLDELKIYNYGMSKSSIRNKYQSFSLPRHSGKGKPIAHWGFERLHKNMVLNQTGKEIHGRLHGNSRIVEGVRGTKAVQFDGKNDWISIPDHPALDPSDKKGFTVSGWFKVSSQFSRESGGQILLVKGTQDPHPFKGWFIRVTPSLNIGGRWDQNPHYLKTYGRDLGFDDNQWHQFHFVYTRTKGESHLKIYFDGNLVAQDRGKLNLETDGKLFFGANKVGEGNYFKGAMDEIKIYNRAFTSSEVKQQHVTVMEKHDRSVNVSSGTGESSEPTIGRSETSTSSRVTSTGLLSNLSQFTSKFKQINSPVLTVTNPSNVVGYWPMEWIQKTEGRKTIPVYSQRNYQSELNRGRLVQGKRGRAMYSVQGGVSVPGLADFDPDKLTVMAWVKPTKLVSPKQFVVSKGGARNKGFHLQIDSVKQSKARLAWKIGNGYEYQTIRSDRTIKAGKWYFVVGTYNEQTSTSALYLNGELVKKINVSPMASDSMELDIGSHPANNSGFHGNIDEVLISKSVLTGRQIKNLYNQITGNAAPETTRSSRGFMCKMDRSGIVADWSFNRINDNVVIDQTGNNIRGTIHGKSPGQLSTPGKGLLFDGNDDYVEVPGHAQLKPRIPYSYSLWVKLLSKPERSREKFQLLQWSIEGRKTGWHLEFRQNGRLVVTSGDGNSLNYLWSNIRDFPVKEWIHVAFARSKQGGKLWVDGNIVARDNKSITVSDNKFLKLLMGGEKKGQNFHGRIRDVKLFRGSLGSSELSVLSKPRCSNP